MLYCIVLYYYIYTVYHNTLYHTLYCMIIFTVYNYILYTIVYRFKDVVVYRFIHYYAIDIVKVDFILRGQNISFETLPKKKCRNLTKNHLMCVKHKLKKKTEKSLKCIDFVVCACKSQDFAHSQKMFVRTHDREIVTFRNSMCYIIL